MGEITADGIEKYCEQHSSPESTLMQALARETYAKMQAPQMQVGHLEGGFLRMLARVSRAKRILEIGTFTGYSALCMAEALPTDGTLITCDIDPNATKLAQQFWSESPHGKKITLKLGPAIDTLKTLPGPFDLVFIDADKGNYLNYWNAVMEKTSTGALIVVDNVLWSGRVLKPQDPTDHAIADFNKKIAADPTVELVMLAVRDGMTLACRK